MPQEYCTDTCTVHPKECIKFYCETCDKIACSKCKTSAHKDCSVITYIPEIVKSREFNDEFKRLQDRIEWLTSGVQTTDTTIRSTLKFFDNNKQNVIFQIEAHKDKVDNEIETEKKKIINDLDMKREQILKRLDQEKREKLHFLDIQQAAIRQKLEETKDKLCNEASATYKADQMKLNSLSLTTTSLKKQLQHLQLKIKRKSAGEKCGIFVAIKNENWDALFKKIENDNELVTADVNIKCMGFLPSDGQISINSPKEGVTLGKLELKSNVKRNVKYEHDIWTEDSAVIGICKVSDTKLLIACSGKSSLKTIDTKKRTVFMETPLSSEPNAMTIAGDQHVAVSLPEERKIQHLSLAPEDHLTIQENISIDEKCTGLTFNNPNIVAIYSCPNRVQILDVNGQVQRNVNISLSAATNIQIAFSPRSKTLYIANNNTVKHMDFEGSILHERMLPNKTIISALAMDLSGTIYVSSIYPKWAHGCCISQLSSDLTVVHKLTQCVNHIQEYAATCLYYCDKEDKLFVGFGEVVREYKLC